MGKHLKFISSEYLDSYSSKCKIDWLEVFHKLRSKSTFTTDDFEYYLIASSLYSSKIEGNSLDANSFFRNRGNKTFPKKKEVQEIEDLVKAYKFASENNLNKTNFLKTHEISAKTLLPANVTADWRSAAELPFIFKYKSYGGISISLPVMSSCVSHDSV